MASSSSTTPDPGGLLPIGGRGGRGHRVPSTVTKGGVTHGGDGRAKRPLWSADAHAPKPLASAANAPTGSAREDYSVGTCAAPQPVIHRKLRGAEDWIMASLRDLF